MVDADNEPRPKAPMAVGDKLDNLSLHELEERISAFEAEIARLRRTVAEKRSSQAAAESFFKGGS